MVMKITIIIIITSRITVEITITTGKYKYKNNISHNISNVSLKKYNKNNDYNGITYNDSTYRK